MAFSTCQMMPGIGRHCQNVRIRIRLASKTYVLRSIGSGITFVQASLNHGRAMTECCSANIASTDILINSDMPKSPSAPESIDFGTSRLPTKPIA
jgi:hypothetical protein